MVKHRSPCNDAENLLMPRDAQIPIRCPFKICSRCANLVTNPSFETGLSGWETDNVVTSNDDPFEGTRVAKLGPGVASMFQDISLSNLGNWPLFLSFNVNPGSNDPINFGNLVAEVSWLDANHNIISSGLRSFFFIGRLRLTYFDITDRPPVGAAWARLQFSKWAGQSSPADIDIIFIDQVILTPVGAINLVQNPSFEAGLAHWTPEPPTSFVPHYSPYLEGLAYANAPREEDGNLLQDVSINHLPAGSTFMLSFAAYGIGICPLTVRVQWLDATDNPIGDPGINLFIPDATLGSSANSLTYLDITDPAPVGTLKARIIFSVSQGPNPFFYLDQVIFARVATKNLVINPSFEDGLTGWTSVNTTSFSKDDVYEGNNDAQMGQDGGSLVQDVPIVNAVGGCFLFNCGLGYRKTEDSAGPAQMIIKVLWLDNRGREIGLGLSIISDLTGVGEPKWLVYTGITEPAPPGTAAARLQFTKSASLNSVIEVDKVVLGRLI